jgi:hypothetical protein
LFYWRTRSAALGEPRETVDDDLTGKLDWNYILEQLRPLAELKGKPEIVDQLVSRRKEFEQ